MIQLQKFSNLINLLTYFNDGQVCRDYLETVRWGGDLKCAYKDCQHDKIFKYSNGKVYKCAKCHRQYSVRVGTIFEDSKIPLQKWYAAIYLITAHKKGISSLQLHRDLGITQKTAWYLLHRVRTSLGLQSEDKLTGNVEADETFIGGNEKNKHLHKKTENNQGRSVKTKSAVAGVVERGGELRANKVPDTTGRNLRGFVFANVDKSANLYTDEWWGYSRLNRYYNHSVIKHNEGQYVNGNTHTNTLEGFWSLLKRGVVGIYHSMSDKHLQRYIDEFVFRYNTRNLNESDRFNLMLDNLETNLTYAELIKKNGRNNRKMEAKQGIISF